MCMCVFTLQEEGELIIEGLLNISWGLRRPIRLQMQDDHERIRPPPSSTSWHSGCNLDNQRSDNEHAHIFKLGYSCIFLIERSSSFFRIYSYFSIWKLYLLDIGKNRNNIKSTFFLNFPEVVK